jgi:hypothetical protein
VESWYSSAESGPPKGVHMPTTTHKPTIVGTIIKTLNKLVRVFSEKGHFKNVHFWKVRPFLFSENVKFQFYSIML